MNQTEDEGDEDVGLPSELERMVAHEDQEMGPHQEETELVYLGIGSGKREVKIGTGITASIREELIILLKDYQDIFAWSYQDMPSTFCFRYPFLREYTCQSTALTPCFVNGLGLSYSNFRWGVHKVRPMSFSDIPSGT